MKFAVVVVLFALALGGAQSSVLHWPVHAPVVYTAVHPPAAVAIHESPVVLSHAHVHAASPALIISHPVVHAPAVVAVAPAEGTYVAKTRGSVHVAPLPGHANSASSVNLEPAPGTA